MQNSPYFSTPSEERIVLPRDNLRRVGKFRWSLRLMGVKQLGKTSEKSEKLFYSLTGTLLTSYSLVSGTGF